MTLERVPGRIMPAMGIASGELARRAGISADTLRHYERVGVLARPPRSAANYRIYPETALQRVLLVRRALAFGFSLAELSVVLRERERGAPPCRKVRALAEEKLSSIETRLAELTRLRDQLQSLLKDWDRRLEGAPENAPAHLLESLSVPKQPNASKETPHEHPRADPRRRPHPLAGHWSQRGASPKGDESPVKRTPAPGRKKR
ncbi:MAG: heavy metal-responsive transcriptional regulator [Vicinamibacteria bacterium]|nr:heavy metal-responsive transcriptional regulator [Vicinamibacteria bacterium]